MQFQNYKCDKLTSLRIIFKAKFLQMDHRISQIKKINQQLDIISTEVNNQQCFQTTIRQLLIADIQNNQKNCKELCQKLEKMLIKYGFDQEINFLKDINIKRQDEDDGERYKKIKELRQNILPLNTFQIIRAKQQIQSNSYKCQNADAINIIGCSGSGQTTLLVGASGFRIQFNQQTRDYRPADIQIARKYVVRNGMISQTRKLNMSVVNRAWAQDDNILLIDIPYIGQTRDYQIDIINNMAKLNILRKLKSARVVIILTKHQFQGRCYEYIRRFIKSTANQLINFDNYRRSTVFVYTKGLNYLQVSQKLKEFFEYKQAQYQKWTDNEEKFIKFLKKNFLDSDENQEAEQFQILDPSKHHYKYLIQNIMKKYPNSYNSNSISTTITQATYIKLNQMLNYLQKMVYKTFELQEFQLTLYYLNQIKSIQSSIQEKDYLYKKIEKSLKDSLQNKLDKLCTCFKRFYIENSYQYIQNIKQVRKFYKQIQKNEILIKLLYKQYQSFPLEFFQRFIQQNLKEPLKQIQQASRIPKDKRKDVLSCLKLIKHLKSQHEYQSIIRKIKRDNHQIENNINQILYKNRFDQNDWRNAVNYYINQFRLDGIEIEQIQSYQNINQIIQKYFDSKPQQYLTILKYLNHDSKVFSMDGSLQNVCYPFFDKLTKLKQTHFIIKEVVQPKFNQIIKLLKQTNAYYATQKDQIFKSLDIKSIQILQVYERNSKQILRILIKFTNCSELQYENIRQQQTTIYRMKQKMFQYVQNIIRQIDQLPLKSQNINPSQINQHLKIIFTSLNFIRNTNRANERLEYPNQKHTEILNVTLKQSEQNLLKIKRKIQRVVYNTNIENYALNYKLILCLLITRQFTAFFQRYFENQLQQQLQKLARKIENKLIQPIYEIQKISFKKSGFQKLLKVLKYTKLLDDKCIKYRETTKNFQFTTNFANNQRLIQALKQSFQLVQRQETSVECIKQVIMLSQRISSNKNTNYIDDLLERKKSQLNKINVELSQKAVNYILCYEQISMICKQFAIFCVVEDFSYVHLEKLDLQKLLLARLYQIDALSNDSLKLKALDRQNLLDLNKQFKFFYQILEKAQRSSKISKFNKTEANINNLINSISQNFENQLSAIEYNFKSIKTGVDFDCLKNLQTLLCSENQQYKKRISLLFNSINNQYSKLMKQIYVNFDPKGKITQNGTIFLNIYKFIQITKRVEHQMDISIKINFDLLQHIQDNLFLQLINNFDQLIKQLQYGKPYNHDQMIHLSRIQRNFKLCFQNRYKSWLKQFNIQNSLEKRFQQQMKEIKLKHQIHLSQNAIYDYNYHEFYTKTTIQNQNKMRFIAILKIKKQCRQLQRLLKSDYNQANVQDLMDKIVDQFDQMPQAIQQHVVKIISQVKDKKQKIELEKKAKVAKKL